MDTLLSIKTASDLEQLDKVENIKHELKKFIPPFTNIDASTYDELFKIVSWIKKNYIQEGQIFISKRQEYIYYLLEHTNGKERKRKLRVEELFYSPEGVRAAKKWRNGIMHILRADLNDNDRAREAKIKLDDLYQEITQLEVEGDEQLNFDINSDEMHQEV